MHIQYHKQLFLLCIFLFACLLRSLLASNEKKAYVPFAYSTYCLIAGQTAYFTIFVMMHVHVSLV